MNGEWNVGILGLGGLRVLYGGKRDRERVWLGLECLCTVLWMRLEIQVVDGIAHAADFAVYGCFGLGDGRGEERGDEEEERGEGGCEVHFVFFLLDMFGSMVDG